MEIGRVEPSIGVTAGNRESMELKLDAAVAEVREHAVRDGRKGILITRHAPGSLPSRSAMKFPTG
ncbi:hypothetical protein GCM10007170_38340 [Arthrobacter liuii]|uniref:Uncharacterized protein n=1 Tax=Arthrobacter liuii TaxID=1476996 RepID=A0ABQ2AX03_9MICC|nr:hypothetical protein GCM10007170_38340 [Arthrobacter liuii]